jgi:hypothetical protein
MGRNILIKLKRGGPPFSILHAWLVTLQCEHMVSNLKHVVTIGENFYRLAILLGGPSLSLFDMLIMI